MIQHLHGFLGRISSQFEELLESFSEFCEAFEGLHTSHQNIHYFSYTNPNDESLFVGK
jgi:hypothetical protein